MLKIAVASIVIATNLTQTDTIDVPANIIKAPVAATLTRLPTNIFETLSDMSGAKALSISKTPDTI